MKIIIIDMLCVCVKKFIIILLIINFNQITTYSDSTSATVHLYCAVENRQISANCLTDTFIFFTVRLELFAMCTLTDIVSP